MGYRDAEGEPDDGAGTSGFPMRKLFGGSHDTSSRIPTVGSCVRELDLFHKSRRAYVAGSCSDRSPTWLDSLLCSISFYLVFTIVCLIFLFYI